MKRSDFVLQGAALSLAAGLPTSAIAGTETDAFAPVEGAWRTFEVTTVATVPTHDSPVGAWVPVPSFEESDWMRPGKTTFDGNADSAQIVSATRWDVKMVYAQWQQSRGTAQVKVTSIVSTRDLAVDLAQPKSALPLSAADYQLFTSPTKLMPTDGIVAQTAQRIVGSTTNDLDKARAIYEWVVTNSARNPKTRGCGLGDVSFMLETGDLNGKCADINGLFVALARSVGLPARDLYGIRVAPSRFGYKSLGANSSTISKSQHCRAEVYLSDYGWVPADPADVRKVMLEEPPGHLPLTDPKVEAARRTLFGAWEGNYVAFNDGHDVALPGSNGPELGFLMYPQAEVQGDRRDSLAPDEFVYTIESAEIRA